MDRIDDNIVLELLYHPMVRHIVHMAGWHNSWDESRSREDNILMALRYFMITGTQSELMEYMNEQHVLNTENGIVDFNQIAKDRTINELDPLLEYIARKNLVNELEYYNTYPKACPGRMLIYVNQHNQLGYQFLDASGCSSDYVVMYKKFVGMITSIYNSNFYGEYGKDTKLITSKEKIASLISKRVSGKLIYVGE